MNGLRRATETPTGGVAIDGTVTVQRRSVYIRTLTNEAAKAAKSGGTTTIIVPSKSIFLLGIFL